MEENQRRAEHILRGNDTGSWICPARNLYPHQWLWDTCFIAIGLRHINAERAAKELETMLSAQWRNGMVPHMVFSGLKRNFWARLLWGTGRCPSAPEHILTSGITQPPMLAIAALKVADSLEPAAGKEFLERVYPKILAYHEWLYRERDPEEDGLAALVHHWETGMDNTPDWMELLEKLPTPRWIRALENTRLIYLLDRLRRDRRVTGKGQRMTTLHMLKSTHLINRYRKCCYDSSKILDSGVLAVESLFFNSILIRANRCLESIANLTGAKIPNQTRAKFRRAEAGLEDLFDKQTQAYQARNVASKHPLRTVSISSLLPLFTGCISEERADGIVKMLKDNTQFWPAWPVPSVPVHSTHFDEERYWQGPTWVNTNWFIIEGLKLFGYDELAGQLRGKTLRMIEQAGFYEYFSPLTGKGYGIADFSWTAALYLDLVNA